MLHHIVIDGNIGSGKTTQLDLLDQKGWSVKREPLDEWPLELFYTDMSRWALLLQLRILQTLRPSCETTPTVYERCLLSTRHVFWEYLLEKGLVRPEEHRVYTDAYEKYFWYPDMYIYLRKSPETAFQHIQQRHQTGDSAVSLDYLKDLDRLYEKMICNLPCPVHIIECDGKTPAEISERISDVMYGHHKVGP